MKEKDLIKSATDAQMPDLEKIRENILKQAPQKQKPKILTLKPTKLLAVAAVLSLSIIGTIAAVANQNGVFPFSPKPAETKATKASSSVRETTAHATKKAAKTKKKSNKKIVQKKKSKKRNKTKEYLKRLTDRGFEVTWLYDLGKIDDYHIFYAGSDTFSGYDCNYIIGDYTFRADKVHSPYGLGLYACSKKKAFTLADAYKEDIFNDFSDAVDLIEDYEGTDLGIETEENNPISDKFRDYFDDADILTLAELSASDSYNLYYNLPENAQKIIREKEIDGYTFHLTETQAPYDLGLFVTSDNKIYTLEEALDSGILGIDEVISAVNSDNSIPFGFSAEEKKQEETEETTQQETETTQEVTESENPEEETETENTED